MFRSRLIFSAFFFLVAFALLFLVVLPLRAKTSERKAELANLKTDDTRLSQQIIELEEAKKSMEGKEKKLEKLDLLVTSGDQRQDMIAILDILARENLVEIESISIEVSAAVSRDSARGSERLGVTMAGTAPYPTWKDFLLSLEKQVRTADIKEIQLVPNAASSHFINYDLSFDVFYQ